MYQKRRDQILEVIGTYEYSVYRKFITSATNATV